MRKSKIILSLLIISMLASKTFAVKAVNLENDVIQNTEISTQADGTTENTERILVFTPTPSSTK